MIRNPLFYLVLAVLPLVVSCNIYAPLAGSGDPIEEALACLHDGDFNCAVEHYNRLPDGEEKQRRLCTVRMAQSGFGITTLIDVFNEASGGAQGDKVMGLLAGALIPWTAERGEAAEAAVTVCEQYSTTVSTSTEQTTRQLGVLLHTLSLFLDCATRVAKADQYVAIADGVNDCSPENLEPGNRDGVITVADIGPQAPALPSPAEPGMCGGDVLRCAENLENLDAAALGNSDLEGILQAYQNAPDDLKDSQLGEAAIREALRQTVPQ